MAHASSAQVQATPAAPHPCPVALRKAPHLLKLLLAFEIVPWRVLLQSRQPADAAGHRRLSLMLTQKERPGGRVEWLAPVANVPVATAAAAATLALAVVAAVWALLLAGHCGDVAWGLVKPRWPGLASLVALLAQMPVSHQRKQPIHAARPLAKRGCAPDRRLGGQLGHCLFWDSGCQFGARQERFLRHRGYCFDAGPLGLHVRSSPHLPPSPQTRAKARPQQYGPFA